MTDATNQVVIWPFGQSTVIPAFFVAQTPQGFEDKSNDERSADHETQTTLETRRPPQTGDRLHAPESQKSPADQAQRHSTQTVSYTHLTLPTICSV